MPPHKRGGAGDVAKGETRTLESSAVCDEKLSPIRRNQRGSSRLETLAASGRETELLGIALCIHRQEYLSLSAMAGNCGGEGCHGILHLSPSHDSTRRITAAPPFGLRRRTQGPLHSVTE